MGRTESILTDLQIRSEKINYKIPRLAASFLISSLLTLTGCQTHSDDPKMGEMEVVDRGAMMITDSMQRASDSLMKVQNYQDYIEAFDKTKDSSRSK